MWKLQLLYHLSRQARAETRATQIDIIVKGKPCQTDEKSDYGIASQRNNMVVMRKNRIMYFNF